MNFLDQPLSFTRTKRDAQSPVEYASSVTHFERSHRAADRMVLIIGLLALIASLLGWLS